MKRRGNPNWGKDYATLPIVLSQWEALMARLGMDDSTTEGKVRIMRSMKVINFVRKNYNKRYVPEWLLEYMGLDDQEICFSI